MHMAYIWHMSVHTAIYVYQLFGIYGQFGGHICICTYLAVTEEAGAAFGCVLACLSKNIVYVSSFNMLAMRGIFRRWHPYLFSYIYHICVHIRQ